jgi:hypothetical protein
LEADATLTPRPPLGDGSVLGNVLVRCEVPHFASNPAGQAWAAENCPGYAETHAAPSP